MHIAQIVGVRRTCRILRVVCNKNSKVYIAKTRFKKHLHSTPLIKIFHFEYILHYASFNKNIILRAVLMLHCAWSVGHTHCTGFAGEHAMVQ